MTRDCFVFASALVLSAFIAGVYVGEEQASACPTIPDKKIVWETRDSCGYVRHNELYGKAVWVAAKQKGWTK